MKNVNVIYDDIYYDEIEDNMMSAFEDGSDLLDDIDIPWMITEFMKSRHVYMMEQGHPHWMCEFGAVAIRNVLQDRDYPKCKEGVTKYSYGMRLKWMAMMVVYLCNEYDIHAAKLIELITFKDFMFQYPTRHEESFEHAGADMYRIYIEGK